MEKDDLNDKNEWKGTGIDAELPVSSDWKRQVEVSFRSDGAGAGVRLQLRSWTQFRALFLPLRAFTILTKARNKSKIPPAASFGML